MFYEKLKENRIRLSLSIDDLAERLGTSAAEVSRWEAGVAMPNLESAIKLSEILGVSIDYLFKDRKSTSSFSFYTVERDDLKVISKHKIISFSIFLVSIISVLTLLTISIADPLTYVDGQGVEYSGMKAYILQYQEFGTAVAFSLLVMVLSGISLFVPEDKLRKLFTKKM